jgi:glycerophosphoryl diester phosphodiesterase
MQRAKKYWTVVLVLVAFLYSGFTNSFLRPVNEWVPRDSVMFIAHRGISFYYPENSLQSIEASARHGFRAVELDISRSADDSLIVFHDDNGLRLLGVDKDISKFKTTELKKLPILYHGQRSQSYVMTVRELLQTKKEDLLFYFDMKVSSFKDAVEIARLIRAAGCTNSVLVANSSVKFALYLKLKYPEIRTCLEGFDAGKEWTYYFMPRKLRPDFYSGFLQYTNAKHVAWLKEHNLLSRRIVYGVDSSNLKAALQEGFKNIILDYDSSMRFAGNAIR